MMKKLTHKQYKALLLVDEGDLISDETTLKELQDLNLVCTISDPPCIQWLGMRALDYYESTTTIAEMKRNDCG